MKPPHTFLIVDDDADTRFLTRHALEKAFPGARVIETETTEAALTAALDHRPDGVVTDHQLGAADGEAFIRSLRARGVACPIVMVTASIDPKVHRRARDAGAAGVFADGGSDFVAYFHAVLSERDSTAPP